MPGFVGRLVCVGFVLSIFGLAQNIPDAPQPKTPPSNPFPDAPPAPKNNHPPAPDTGITPPQPQPDQTTQQPPQDGVANSREDLYRFSTRVTFVEVPVTVKDGSGHLVEGLNSKDFTVYEDGVPQKLSYFSSDPFPLSVAVVVDTNLASGT